MNLDKPRPQFGDTNNGKRPMRYYYWRTGYGVPIADILDTFWVRQAGEYHTRTNYVTTDQEYPEQNIQLFYQLAGQADLLYDGRLYAIQPGDLIIIPPHKPFAYSSPQPVKHHWIGLEGNWPPFTYQQVITSISIGEHHEINRKFVQIRELLILSPRGYILQAIGLIFDLLSLVLNMPIDTKPLTFEMPEPVQTAVMYLRENYAAPFDGLQCAKAAGVSPSHLRYLFKQWVGVSPGQYHKRYRIQLAQKLLADPSLSIYEVAYHVGFNDPKYFSRVFSQLTGRSPRQYAAELNGRFPIL